MSRPHLHVPRRLSDPRGTILVICLLLMVVAAFLTGLVLVLARNEGSMAATSKGSLQAANAAEYGLELAINSLNPARAATPFATQTLGAGVTATPGLRDGSSNTPQNTGAAACPPGYSTSLGCTGYTFAATGWARAWLITQANTQLEKSLSIYRGCAITEHSC